MDDLDRYRTPAEQAEEAARDAQVKKVLDRATLDGASLLVAMNSGETPEVVERWVDQLWDNLRAGLVADERPGHCERLHAIVLLLERGISEAAARLTRFDIPPAKEN